MKDNIEIKLTFNYSPQQKRNQAKYATILLQLDTRLDQHSILFVLLYPATPEQFLLHLHVTLAVIPKQYGKPK